ncbi:MAG: M16 family metallopeptidase [Candidatus Cryptobacteroides sp.]
MIQNTSPEGLSYIIKRSAGKAACCAISVKCGTRAEEELPEGIAHFVEHCLFKGTERCSAKSINSVLDKLGGELNAYTTKEEIVLHSTTLKEDIRKAVELLLEIASEANFPEEEIEIEKGVVIDEIISYKDSPSEDIFDKFESLFFEGHPLGRLTLGTADSIKNAKREDLLAFYHRYFRPSSMVLSIVADEKEEKLEKMILSASAKYLKVKPAYSPSEQFPPIPRHFSLREDKGNHEVNLILGSSAPSLYDKQKRIATVLLCNILGGPASNSLLNAQLREKHGWVYAAECNYNQYSDAGLVYISIGCEQENLGKCLKSISQILDKLRSEKLGENFLRAAKKQLMGQLAISSDSKETQCLAMGKSVLAFGRLISDEETLKILDTISAEELRALAEELWSEDRISELVYI